MLDDISLPGELDLRTEQPQDRPFMEQLFRSTRPYLELGGMPAAFVDALINQQYTAQQNYYRSQWPNASNFVMLLSGKAIGKIIIDKGLSSLLIVDLAVIPEQRNRGFGTAILRAIQAMAQNKSNSVTLSVDRENNLAKKLYLSLGFKVTDTSETHESMILTPSCG